MAAVIDDLTRAVRIAVTHETLYKYAAPVALSSHVLRLIPRSDAGRLVRRELVVEPTPDTRFDDRDAYGNAVTRVSFAGTCAALRIESRFEIETCPAPPISQGPSLAPLPWIASPEDNLAAYRQAGPVSPTVDAFAHATAAETGHSALDFLDRLNRTLHARVGRHIREEGAAQTAEHTLRTSRGACRDITVLFLAAARCLGMAGRFVSGYQARAETPDGLRHLHAWPEIFLPGSGWHGWDPTHGHAVGDGHVALCAAPEQADTMPVEGGYRGSEPTPSTLHYSVRIDVH